MRIGGVLQDPVSQPANTLWAPATEVALIANCFIPSYRAGVLLSPGGQNTYRDPDTGHGH